MATVTVQQGQFFLSKTTMPVLTPPPSKRQTCSMSCQHNGSTVEGERCLLDLATQLFNQVLLYFEHVKALLFVTFRQHR